MHALEDVSFAVPAGEIRGVIGPNGAGKTTLLNALSGIRRPARGRVASFGADLTGWPPYRVARDADVVRTFQTMRLLTRLSVLDNVLVAADATDPTLERRLLRMRRRGRGTGLERTRAVLAELGLEPLADRRVTDLSHGLRRKIELARALTMQPKVVLLDEPAAGLNGAEREELGQLLLGLRDRGVTVLLVEHQMDLVSAVCDRLTVLDFGRVICEGPSREVVDDERVLHAYLGKPGAAA